MRIPFAMRGRLHLLKRVLNLISSLVCSLVSLYFVILYSISIFQDERSDDTILSPSVSACIHLLDRVFLLPHINNLLFKIETNQ